MEDTNFYEEALPLCEFAVGANNEEGFEECGDLCSYRVSWDFQKSWIYLCQKHYKEVVKKEMEYK